MKCNLLGLLGLLFHAWVWAGASPVAWTLEGAGGPITLLGSVHLGRQDFYPLAPAIEQAFVNAQVLAVELDITAVDEQELARQLARTGYFSDGQASLWMSLTEPLQDQLKHFCTENLCPPEPQLSRMRPWLLSFQLSNQMMQVAGYDPALGVDRYFLDRRASRELQALESLSEQLELFAQLPIVDQNQLLSQTLKDYQQGPAYLNALMDAWYRGDKTALETLVLEPFLSPNNALLYDRLLVKRNHAMADRLMALSATGAQLFVVVGAGHLPGPDGLVALLEARGYRARPL